MGVKIDFVFLACLPLKDSIYCQPLNASPFLLWEKDSLPDNNYMIITANLNPPKGEYYPGQVDRWGIA
jgi:hypothetical protein